ncbi:hypothetical protein EJB05_43153, partial [Eragrostis curvula]
MCGGAILSGFIRPSGAAAAKNKKQQQQQPRRVTADVLWPGLGRKAAEDDFEADFREFERGLSEDDADCGGGDDEDDVIEEVPPPPAPAWFVFGGAAKAAPDVALPTVGENRITNFADEAFSHPNNGDNDLFAMFAFSDNKVPLKSAETAGFLPPVKPVVPTEGFGTNMLSDQSSNSYGSSDFGWDDEIMTSDYTSVFAPNNAVPAYAEPAYLQGGPSKRMRNNYGVAVPQGNGAPSLTQDMSGFDPEMKYLPLPCVESSSEVSMDSLLQNDVTQDGASNGDLWGVDELLMAAGPLAVVKMKSQLYLLRSVADRTIVMLDYMLLSVGLYDNVYSMLLYGVSMIGSMFETDSITTLAYMSAALYCA